jgi:hypothetical protein
MPGSGTSRSEGNTPAWLAAAAALISGFGALYVLFGRIALHAFPFSGDEYSTFLQAELFARGLFHVPAPPHAELFRVDHVIIDQLVRSKYPPGTAALLAPGVRMGVPWLMTPIEGVVALIFTWRAARTVYGDRAALATVAFLGGAPLFIFNFSSFYSHAATTMWLAIAAASLARWTQDRRDHHMVLIGVFLGCAFLTRPLDAVLFGAGLLAFRSARVVILVGLGTLPFLGLHFAYQAAQFGSPLADGYHLYAKTMAELYGAHEAAGQISAWNFVDPLELFNHIDVTRAFLLDWTVPGTVLVAALGLVSLRGEAKSELFSRFALVDCAIFYAVFLFTMEGGDDGPRPRYLSTILFLTAFLAGPGWGVAIDLLRRNLGPRIATAVAIVVWFLPVAQIATYVDQRTPKLRVREGLYSAIAENRVTSGIVVVRAQYPSRYARNGPFFDAPVLFMDPPPGTSLDEIAADFPGKAIYEVTEPPREIWEPGPWQVVRRR